MNDIKPLAIGEVNLEKPIIIAGPCSAESEEQVLETARQLASFGIKVFRAGIWKPRTKPGGFEGVGKIGLPWMKKVKEQTGMLTATEVATAQHVKDALDAGIDILWIGARTSANPFAMQELADALKECGKDVPVLIKNPVNPDIELWIGAIQRIYNAGIHRIGAIHRGFSTYGKHLYRNLPQWHIPVELRRRYPQIPIICDPSHIGGKRELVAPIGQQAYDMGFDGLIIESHCNPDCALSDMSQQITPDVLNFIINSLSTRSESFTTENINLLRQQIDAADNDLLEILCKRMRVCKEIGQYKKEHGMTVLQRGRYDDILHSRVELAKEIGLNPDFIRNILTLVHEESVRLQLELFNKR